MSNLYGKPCAPEIWGVSDFYTKPETNQLLAAKANVSTVYTRAYIDNLQLTLSNSISAVASSQVTQPELDLALLNLQTEIESDAVSLYATKTDTYTKTEVDGLLAGLDLDPASFVRTSPASTAENTIDPGSANAVALTIRGSSTNPTVTEWLNSSGDTVAYAKNNGEFGVEQLLRVGRLISDGGVAIHTNNKRITALGNPVLNTDAVPLGFLKSYILDFYNDSPSAVKDDVLILICSDETSDLQSGTASITLQMPYSGTLLAARATVNTAPAGSAIVVDVNKDGASILSTKLTIGVSETTSTGNAYVISDDVLPDGSKISVDIDQVGSITPGTGLKVTLYILKD